MMSFLQLWQVQVLLFVSVLDVFSTMIVLNKGGVELNPILRFFMRGPKFVWPLFKLGLTVVVAWFAVKYGYLDELVIFTVIMGLVVINNFRVAAQ